MNDEDFEKYSERIKDVFVLGTSFDGNELVIDDYLLTEDERKQKLKEILEEIYQKGKDDKFKDIGYLDVDEYYPEEKEAKP